MRIARIIEYFPPHAGGMERHGLMLSKEQIKMGNNVEVFIGVGDKKLLPEIYKMPLKFLPLYGKSRRFWFNIWAYFAVKKHHKKNPYDIMHFHGDFIEAFFGGKLSKKLGIPSVLTIHAGLNKKLLKPKNAKCFSNIDKIICVSKEIFNDLKSIGIPEIKLAVISSGVYLVEFQSADQNKIIALRNQYSKPIIVSVGVLRPAKGFKYLIEAFKKIKEKLNGANMVIIGEGSDKAELEKQARNTSGIHFMSRQNHGGVIEYLKAADIFALASISMEGDREGTPTSIMEAMAAGLPVVATKVGGNPYLIKDGENGFLVDEKNSEALAQAIIKLSEDEILRLKIKEKNLEDIKQKDWPEIARKITEIY
ncbi:glycosyltransferase family 4 protein [Candidatus Azambacteria bacterium]|nr:glycosyltransferase family 4 protein [Candidatus Azambacteria bacterium]